MISSWLNNNNYKTKLLYRCSEDGDDSSIFHSKCNDISPTIVLIKTKDNIKFVGYTSARWNNVEDYSSDKNAFIFSLSKKKKYLIKKYEKAIFGGKINGPIFGTNEIYIRNKCLSEGGANSNYNNIYGLENSGELNNGKENFDVVDYEVYQIN